MLCVEASLPSLRDTPDQCSQEPVRVQSYADERSQTQCGGRAVSFLLDPPLLVGCGAVAEKLAGDKPQVRAVLRNLTVGGFIGGSLALYANVSAFADRWPLLGARSGREFMLTSGLARVDEGRITVGQHAAAISLFALYPIWYEVGRSLARR